MGVPPSVAIIVNPISGTGGRHDLIERRVGLARQLAEQRGLNARVLVTDHSGHGRALAEAAMDAGASTVVAWGGDGTINEVGRALAFRNTVLGIVPSGSGNGLARELGIPLTPEAAFDVAIGGTERIIDAGELDGHLFFNIAGIGFDARVAHEFAAHGHSRRGFRRYMEITLRELFRYTPDDHTVVVNGTAVRSRMLMMAIANARQYGNGALIAPQARLDDGALDVVVIDDRPVWRALLQIPRIFMGQIARVPGVTMLRGQEIEVSSERSVIVHVDGEPFVGGARLRARVHPQALRVRVPA